jgi:hypothetical protein
VVVEMPGAAPAAFAGMTGTLAEMPAFAGMTWGGWCQKRKCRPASPVWLTQLAATSAL